MFCVCLESKEFFKKGYSNLPVLRGVGWFWSASAKCVVISQHLELRFRLASWLIYEWSFDPVFFPGGPSVYRFNVRNLVLNRFCPLEQTCLHPRKSMFGRWIKLPFGTFLFRPHFQGSANVCFAGFRVECTVHVKVAVQPTPLVVIATGTRRGQCCCGGCHPNLRDAECCRDGARQGVGWLGGDVGSSAVGFLGPICSPFWFTEFHAKYNSCWMIFNES